MTRSSILIAITLTLLVSNAAGQYDYQKKGYVPPPISGATRCVKNAGTGNTPALCPGAVPLTDEGKPGSTQCVTAVNGTSYEGVLSLFYPAPNAVPWCTTDAQCGATPGIICATPGPTGSGNVCIPLAPAACPYPASDQVNSTVPSTVAAAGRKLLSV